MPITGSLTEMTMNGIVIAITSVAEMPGSSAIGTVIATANQNAAQ